MNEFLHEDVTFDDMPDNVRSWKQNAKISVVGDTAKKTTTRKLVMKDGTDREIEKTEERKFDLT